MLVVHTRLMGVFLVHLLALNRSATFAASVSGAIRHLMARRSNPPAFCALKIGGLFAMPEKQEKWGSRNVRLTFTASEEERNKWICKRVGCLEDRECFQLEYRDHFKNKKWWLSSGGQMRSKTETLTVHLHKQLHTKVLGGLKQETFFANVGGLLKLVSYNRNLSSSLTAIAIQTVWLEIAQQTWSRLARTVILFKIIFYFYIICICGRPARKPPE